MYDKEALIQYNRSNGKLVTRSLYARVGVSLMRLATITTAPFGYVGISRIHDLIGKMFSKQSITEIGFVSGGLFAYPSGDYYYNRLLTLNWDYEEDIQAVLRALSSIEYTFLDIGANFGFFSALAASQAFGSQQIVAVEPSKSVFSLLERNLKPYSANTKLYRLAIDCISGKEVELYGDRHAGFSLSPEWAGASRTAVDAVKTTTIDDLITLAELEPTTRPILIKLEVEGIEMRALQGSVQTLASDAALIIEEIDAIGLSEATKFVFNELGLKMYFADGPDWRQIESLTKFAEYRKTQQGVQRRGTSILAFRGEQWLGRLKSLLPITSN